MSERGPEDEAAIWRNFVRNFSQYVDAAMSLWRCKSLIDLLRAGLHNPQERAAAMDIVERLPPERKLELFGDLVALASYVHGLTDAATAAILSLPRDWVLVNIEKHSDTILQNGTYEEYRALLRLYEELSPDLARALATRAARDADPDIREVGEDALERLGGAGAGSDGDTDKA